jgi:hypothetical protein
MPLVRSSSSAAALFVSSSAIARFYGAAAGIIDEWDGIVDKSSATA